MIYGYILTTDFTSESSAIYPITSGKAQRTREHNMFSRQRNVLDSSILRTSKLIHQEVNEYITERIPVLIHKVERHHRRTRNIQLLFNVRHPVLYHYAHSPKDLHIYTVNILKRRNNLVTFHFQGYGGRYKRWHPLAEGYAKLVKIVDTLSALKEIKVAKKVKITWRFFDTLPVGHEVGEKYKAEMAKLEKVMLK